MGALPLIFNRAKVETVLFTLLDKCEAAGQRMSDSKQAGNYAPRVFTKRPDAGGYSARDFGSHGGAVCRLGNLHAALRYAR